MINGGRFFIDANYNINQNWRTGFSLKRTSDNYYLNDFLISAITIFCKTIFLSNDSKGATTQVLMLVFPEMSSPRHQRRTAQCPALDHP